MKILVLDDDRDFATGVAVLIERMGHEAVIAYDCGTARKLAGAELFDVILADVELLDGDGRHTCIRLRLGGASQTTAYMVAMTGRSDLGDNDFASFDGYMRKPVTYELLECVLEEWRVTDGLDRQARADKAQVGRQGAIRRVTVSGPLPSMGGHRGCSFDRVNDSELRACLRPGQGLYRH